MRRFFDKHYYAILVVLMVACAAKWVFVDGCSWEFFPDFN